VAMNLPRRLVQRDRLLWRASGDRIRALSVNAALVQGLPASTTDQVFVYPGVAPAISANGTKNGILWAVKNVSQAVLYAYDASPTARNGAKVSVGDLLASPSFEPSIKTAAMGAYSVEYE
jgi:hypothetical protein